MVNNIYKEVAKDKLQDEVNKLADWYSGLFIAEGQQGLSPSESMLIRTFILALRKEHAIVAKKE